MDTANQSIREDTKLAYKFIGLLFIISGIGCLGFLLINPAEHVFRYLATGSLCVVLGVFIYSNFKITFSQPSSSTVPTLDLAAALRRIGCRAANETLYGTNLEATMLWLSSGTQFIILQLPVPGVLVKSRGFNMTQSLTDLNGEAFEFEYDRILKKNAAKVEAEPVIWIQISDKNPSRTTILNNGVIVLHSPLDNLISVLTSID